MRQIGMALVVALLLGCGGGGDKPTTATAQGAAQLWLQAAMEGNDARVRELTVPEAHEKCIKVAAEARERFGDNRTFKWTAGDARGKDLGWSALGPGGVVFLVVREVGPKQWKVAEAEPSW